MRSRAKSIVAVDQASVLKRIAAITALPSMTLYNPSDEWVLSEVCGQTFCVPPDLAGELVEHPFDCVGIKQSTKRNDTEENDLVPEKVAATGELRVGDYITSRGIRAIGVAEIIAVTVDNFKDRGVTLLDLDARKADKEKKASRQVWQQWRRNSAQQLVEAWGEKVALHQKNPATKDKPIAAPAKVREAQEFLDGFADSGEAFAFICKTDGYATNDQTKFSRHMRVQHGQSASDDVPAIKRGKRQEAAPAA